PYELGERRHVPAHPGAEREVDSAVPDPECALSLEGFRDAAARLTLAGTAREDPEGDAVNVGEMLDVEDGQVVRAQELAHRMNGEIGEVLVVGRVKFVALDEVDHIRDLDDEDASRAERELDRLDELVDVVDMGQHVRRGDRRRSAV